MGVFEARGSLAKAMKDLTARWNDIRVMWNDERAEEIEQTLLMPMEMDVRFAENAMDQLATLLSTAKRDCE